MSDKPAAASGRGRGQTVLLWAAAFVFVIAAIVLLVASFELYMRWHYRDVISTAHGFDYFMRKNFSKYLEERNEHGFRGRDYPDRNPDAYRIVVIGDSFAWGQGLLPYSDRFPEQAEAMFRQRHPEDPIEVINLGVPGHNLRHYLKMVAYVRELEPDFVLYQWYVNDMDDKPDIPAFHAHRLIPDEGWHNWMKMQSVTYILLFRAWNQLRTVLGLQKTYTAYLVDRLGDENSPASLQSSAQLHRLITELRDGGIACGIVLFPQLDSRLRDYRLGFLHDRVLEECRRRQIPCLDLREDFTAFDGNIEELWANHFDPHPSRIAHRIAAERIVGEFAPIWHAQAVHH